MTSNDAPLPPEQKLRALRQIQFALDQSKLPSARACALTEAELRALASEGLIELWLVADEGPELDRHDISRILPAGLAILTRAAVAEPDPLRVTVVTPPKSIWRRIFQGTRSGLWDLIKIAFGAALGWLLKG